jgi:hypothetical protein
MKVLADHRSGKAYRGGQILAGRKILQANTRCICRQAIKNTELLIIQTPTRLGLF